MTKKEADKILNILHTIPTKVGWFPKIEDIAKRLKLPKYKASKILKELNELGMLSRTGNWYNFIYPIEATDQQAKDYIDAITEENKHDSIEVQDELVIPLEKLPKSWQKRLDDFAINKIGDLTVMPNKINKKQDNVYLILRYVMGIIGIGAGIISAYYSQIWQHETLNIFWSWFLSLIMIGFSSAAFLTLIGIITKSISNKWSTWGLAIIFFLLWIICLIYSLQVTIAGRFSQYQAIASKMENNNSNKLKLDNMNDSINELKKNRAINQKQLDILLQQYDYSQLNMSVKGETFQSIQNRIVTIQNVLKDINKNIENKNIEYEKIMKSNVIIDEKFGFYDWAAKIYKTDRSNIEWIMLLFPSLFLDIASPIALAVFMFLGRKKEEYNEYK